ncbi:MAG: hypothetical protein Q4D68_03500 [Moraxella equi]|nr:hypothetical protein [Moraxella equi]
MVFSKKFIGAFIVSALLVQSAYALSIVPYNPSCRFGMMYIPISDKTSIELMQILQNEFDKDTNECGSSSMVYDKRTSVLIIKTLPNNAESITEFIQKTDRKLNMGNHSKNTDNEMPTNPDDKTDDENTD